jgi:DNA-binding response OmpR family regulator
MAELILVIDDDATLRRTVAKSLQLSGYRVIEAAEGLSGLRQFHEQHPALVILDVSMPTMDGWTTCARLREISNAPILMLTARSAREERVRGFALGVDDYVVKPFFPEELAARVGAILRRTRAAPAASPAPPSAAITRGNVRIDLATRRVTRAEDVVRLSPTEYRLLAALAAHPGVPQAAAQLLKDLWGEGQRYDTENLRTYIRYLREKLEADPAHPQIILTERGFGYYLA